MKFEYIDINGNKALTEDIVRVPENFIKIDNIYFEKGEVLPVEVVKETNNKEVEERALVYMKEQKVRGAHLLKWERLIAKAVEQGFIIN